MRGCQMVGDAGEHVGDIVLRVSRAAIRAGYSAKTAAVMAAGGPPARQPGLFPGDAGGWAAGQRRPRQQDQALDELFTGGRIVEAGCWAHVRRKFFDVHAATGSPIAK
jgi:hypothetical protein